MPWATQQTLLLFDAADTSAVVWQQTCLLWDTADMSAMWHTRHVCRVKQLDVVVCGHSLCAWIYIYICIYIHNIYICWHVNNLYVSTPHGSGLSRTLLREIPGPGVYLFDCCSLAWGVLQAMGPNKQVRSQQSRAVCGRLRQWPVCMYIYIYTVWL